MRAAAVIILLLPVLTFVRVYDREQLLSPRNTFSFLYFLRILLPAVIYASTTAVGRISDAYVRESVLSDNNYLVYGVIQTVSYYCVMFGMRLKPGKVRFAIHHRYRERNDLSTNDDNYKHYFYWGVIFTIIGFVDFLVIMQRSGGIIYFLTHLQYRSLIFRDLDLLSWLLIFLHYGPLLMVYAMRGRNKRISVFLFALVILSGFMCGLGGRKTMILMIIEMLFVYHFTVKELSLKSILRPRNIAIAIIVYVFFTLMVQFRATGAFETFLENPLEFVSGNKRSLSSIITGESYVKYYMAVIDYFKDHSLWFGRSFLGLLTAFIPSSLYSAKPPVDDGMYLYSICLGREDILPVMPTKSLNLSSYPLETFGSMYANFGVLGVVLGMVILGVVINKSYQRLQRNNYRVLDIIIYVQMLFCFELSTLRIFQILEIFIMLGVIVFFVDRLPITMSLKGRR